MMPFRFFSFTFLFFFVKILPGFYRLFVYIVYIFVFFVKILFGFYRLFVYIVYIFCLFFVNDVNE